MTQETLAHSRQIALLEAVILSEFNRSIRTVEIEYGLVIADDMNVGGPVIIGVYANPQPIDSKDGRHFTPSRKPKRLGYKLQGQL
jgi:hypothetical protein